MFGLNIDEGRDAPNTSKSWPIKWRFAEGRSYEPTLTAGLEALWFSIGSGPEIAKELYSFVIFQPEVEGS